MNVAEVFGKEHFVVLKAIENLECSKAFADNNFIVGEYADKNNQMRKMYEMTRDGFSFLVMGFTGAKAGILSDEIEPNQKVKIGNTRLSRI